MEDCFASEYVLPLLLLFAGLSCFITKIDVNFLQHFANNLCSVSQYFLFIIYLSWLPFSGQIFFVDHCGIFNKFLEC